MENIVSKCIHPPAVQKLSYTWENGRRRGSELKKVIHVIVPVVAELFAK